MPLQFIWIPSIPLKFLASLHCLYFKFAFPCLPLRLKSVNLYSLTAWTHNPLCYPFQVTRRMPQPADSATNRSEKHLGEHVLRLVDRRRPTQAWDLGKHTAAARVEPRHGEQGQHAAKRGPASFTGEATAKRGPASFTGGATTAKRGPASFTREATTTSLRAIRALACKKALSVPARPLLPHPSVLKAARRRHLNSIDRHQLAAFLPGICFHVQLSIFHPWSCYPLACYVCRAADWFLAERLPWADGHPIQAQ